MATFIIGLTGGIGSGKTTVSNLFAEQGVSIVDADVIARSVVEKGSKALNRIAEYFGDEILLNDGTLNRPLLRSRVFSDDVKKTWLNNLLHPLIRTSLVEQLDACNGEYCILSAPLLFENKLELFVNRVLVIDVAVDTQIERTCRRDNSKVDEIRAIVASQISRDKRLDLADDIIDNETSDLAKLKQRVLALHSEYITLASNSQNA